MASVDQIVTENCLDFIGQTLIFRDGESRLKYHERFKIAELLVLLTEGSLAEDLEPAQRQQLIPRPKALHEWKSMDWKGFRRRLCNIQLAMMRYDASASIDDIYRGDSENRLVDPSRADDEWFTDKLSNVLALFSLHEELAPFREILEEHSSISGDEALVPLSLPDWFVEDFTKAIDNLDGGSVVQTERLERCFCTFLKNDGTDAFHSASTIRKLLDDPSQMYSYSRLLNKVNKLIRHWVSTVFEAPTIVGNNNNRSRTRSRSRMLSSQAVAKQKPPPINEEEVFPERETGNNHDHDGDDGQARALKRLQRSRARLKDHVNDPLPAAVAMAARANATRKRKHRPLIAGRAHRDENDDSDDDNDDSDDPIRDSDEESDGDRNTSTEHRPATSKTGRRRRLTAEAKAEKGGRLLEKKETAERLDFTQSDDDDEVLPDVKRRIQISLRTSLSSPARHSKKSQEKSYEGRRLWSDVEKNAVIDGIIKFGIGNWATIKRNEAVILRDRTSGQIKDCYRTMKKRGELDGVEEAWPESKQKSTAEEEEENGTEEKEQDEENDGEEESEEEGSHAEGGEKDEK
eukprot:jgi/Psemu1/323002/estExt_fgenesh1_pg.C_520020